MVDRQGSDISALESCANARSLAVDVADIIRLRHICAECLAPPMEALQMTYNVNPVAQLNQSPARRESKQRFCRIKVRDLVLLASIGVFDREKTAQQRVRINVDLKVAESLSSIDDNIANVLSYKDIIDGIRSILTEGHINLVETLAERIAQMCLADGRVALARVGVEKLDIEPDAAAVGVEIERTRLDF